MRSVEVIEVAPELLSVSLVVCSNADGRVVVFLREPAEAPPGVLTPVRSA